jgi:hypothetical protein
MHPVDWKQAKMIKKCSGSKGLGRTVSFEIGITG